jgi:hypothetical protein
MSNQMIALQAKGPKLADPAAQTAKFVNMMNMTKQQEAAERQAAQAQQQMTLAQRKDAREEALQGPALTKAELDNIRAQIDDLEEQYKMVSTEEGHQFWLGRVRKVDEAIADQIGMYVPNFDPEKVNNIMLTAKQAVDKIDPDAKATIEYAGKGGVDEQGNPIPEGTAIQVITGKKPSTQVIRNAPNAASPAPAAAPQTPAGPVPTGKFGETLVVPEASVPLTPYQQDHIRSMQEGLGMKATGASFTPGSMGTPTAGQMTPDMVPGILDSAVNTGVMAQIDLDQMLALAPPQARQGIMDVIRSNKIALQTDAPSLAASGMGQQQPMAPNPVQRPDAGFAVYRGGQPPQSRTAALGGDMSMMRNTEAQYQPLQRRNPNVSPTPGVYNVPTQDVAATSRATRPSAGEVYDTELAKIKAARAAGPAPATPKEKRARQTEVAKAYSQTQSLIDKTYSPKEGAIALARKIKLLSPDQKEAITGFSGYVPSFRESSREADTLIGNLKGVVTALGKDAAAASGAIGPMAVQEWKIVSDQIANLDLEGMTPRALDAQMDRIIQQVSNATRLAERVYDVQFGDDLKEYPSFKLRGIPPAKAKTPVTKAPPGVSATEWKAMTPAERKLWQ